MREVALYEPAAAAPPPAATASDRDGDAR
jgi:hypothetical protein